jgi:hydrogenase maturation protease
MNTPRIVVLGVGNEYRSDDGAGLAVAKVVATRAPSDVRVLECEQEPSRLIDAWEDAELAVVVDAVASGATPGTVHRFDASEAPIPSGVFRSSTHAFGVGDAIELARTLGRLPRHVVVFGVEGDVFGAGSGLSPLVEEAVEPTADAVLAELSRLEEEPCTSAH